MSSSKNQLSHAMERVAVYRRDPATLLPYARSMIALADEIERLQQKLTAAEQLAVRQACEIRRLRGPVKGEPA
jgi:hypothetical protein